MKGAIDVLMAEHRRILGVLDALERFAGSEGSSPSALAPYVEFLTLYADAQHHAKEEDILFAVMVDHGFPRDAGPIAVMLHEHDLGRELVEQLRAASSGDRWTGDDRAAVTRAAGDLCVLLRHHIAKEDQVLYPMAQARLPAEAMAAVDDRCASADAANADTSRLEALAATLTGG